MTNHVEDDVKFRFWPRAFAPGVIMNDVEDDVKLQFWTRAITPGVIMNDVEDDVKLRFQPPKPSRLARP